MYLLGQWPFQHTLALKKVNNDTGMMLYYNADTNTIVSNIESENMLIIPGYHVVISSKLYDRIKCHIDGGTVPPVPQHIHMAIKKELVPSDHPTMIASDMIDNSPVMVVSGGSVGDTMDALGASFNTFLGMWCITDEQLKKGIDISNHSRNISYSLDGTGKWMVIKGDVSKHSNTIQRYGGVFDIARKYWKIPVHNMDRIRNILGK